MFDSESDPALSRAATALSEATRLEQIRDDESSERWMLQLGSLATVVDAGARLATCLGERFVHSADTRAWGGPPAHESLTAASTSALQAAAALHTAAALIAEAHDRLLSLPPAPAPEPPH